MKLSSVLWVLLLFSCSRAYQGESMVIDTLLDKNNYAEHLWEPRGLNPSSSEVIGFMETTTNEFLVNLKKIKLDDSLTQNEKLEKVNELVDELPWLDLDTEEKEFLADVLAPAIESLGFDPWKVF